MWFTSSARSASCRLNLTSAPPGLALNGTSVACAILSIVLGGSGAPGGRAPAARRARARQRGGRSVRARRAAGAALARSLASRLRLANSVGVARSAACRAARGVPLACAAFAAGASCASEGRCPPVSEQ